MCIKIICNKKISKQKKKWKVLFSIILVCINYNIFYIINRLIYNNLILFHTYLIFINIFN